MILLFCKEITVFLVACCKKICKIAAIAIFAFFLMIACQKDSVSTEAIPEDAVILDINVSVKELPDTVYGNSLHEIQYSWSETMDNMFNDDLMVMVHFVNDDNRVVFQDDHPLPDESHRQSYIRNVLVPLIPRPQNIRMMVGLYQPDSTERFYIPDHEGNYQNKIKTQKFKVTPPVYLDDLPEARITFGEGWYQKEYDPKHVDSWRWISDEAHCLLKGADRDLLLYIHGWAPNDVFEKPLSLSLFLAGENIGTYTDLTDDFIINLQITPEQIHPNETEELVIQSNQSFSPAEFGDSLDNRDLSVMIKQFYFN